MVILTSTGGNPTPAIIDVANLVLNNVDINKFRRDVSGNRIKLEEQYNFYNDLTFEIIEHRNQRRRELMIFRNEIAFMSLNARLLKV